jgi:TonB-linked SusC/RagA family outer membrane protein
VTIKKTNAPLIVIFKEIKKQTGYNFFCKDDLLKKAHLVSIDASNEPIESVLAECFSKQPLTYSMINKTIIVTEKIADTAAGFADNTTLKNSSENRGVSGKVTTSEGKPLEGATVSVKGTTIATSTDVDGFFRLSDVEENSVLIITNVSYEQQEVKLNKQAYLTVFLEQKISDLNEAIVVAYNTTTHRSNVGALTVIKGEQIQTLPNRSFEKSLQGLVAGLLVTPGTGQPGGGLANFIGRGPATATQPPNDNTGAQSLRNPLIVIDGVPVPQDFSQLISFQTVFQSLGREGNPMAQINLSDVDHFTILKDAAAVALYGARAGNGVILVTTKKGKAGKTVFRVRQQTDIATRLKGKREVLNQQEYINLMIETYMNTPRVINGVLTPYTEEEVIGLLKSKFPTMSTNAGGTTFYPEADWSEEMYNNHPVTFTNEISMSGGNEKNNFYVSIEYSKQNGLVKNTSFDRKAIRFNFENRPASWLKLGLNSALSYNIQKYMSDLSLSIFTISPLNPVRDISGEYIYNFPVGLFPSSEAFPNPVAVNRLNINENTSFRGLTKLYGELKFLKYFTLNTSLGTDFILTEAREKWDPRIMDYYVGSTGRIEEGDSRRANIVTTNLLRFNKSFFARHFLEILLGQEAQVASQKDLGVQATGLALPYYDQISSPGVSHISGGLRYKETLQSFFGQINYAYKNKYLFTGSIRRDGSSKFGDDKKYGTYWSLGGAWNITDEPFVKKNLRWLGYLKIRGSVGSAGNAGAIWPLTRFDRVYNTTYLGGIAIYSGGNSPANPDVKWENTFSWDAGVETRLLKGRIAFTLDIYKRITSDLIYNIQLPQNSGFVSILANVGEMENKGVEVSFLADVIRSGEFVWKVSANWSTNQNILVKTNVPLVQTLGPFIGNQEGQSFNSFYLVKWAGVDPADGTPLWYDADGKVSKVYNSTNARQFVGKSMPDGFGAFTNSFSFKNWELSVMLYYQYGAKIYDEALSILSTDGQNPYFTNEVTDALNYWRQPGDVAPNPRRLVNNPDGGTQPSTRYLFDASYVRLQNIILSYEFPQSIIDRLHLTNCRAFIQGNNIALWTKFPGFDPGITDRLSRSTSYGYPNQQSYSLGIQLAF